MAGSRESAPIGRTYGVPVREIRIPQARPLAAPTVATQHHPNFDNRNWNSTLVTNRFFDGFEHQVIGALRAIARPGYRRPR